MKNVKSSFYFLLTGLVVLSCIREPQYTINGYIDGMTDGTLYLGQWINDGIMKYPDRMESAIYPIIFYLIPQGWSLPKT
jgi:hypothetical protein